MGIAMWLDDMAINEAVARLRGTAMGIAMGLDGMAFNEAAAGLTGAAMDEAMGLDGMAIVLADVRARPEGLQRVRRTEVDKQVRPDEHSSGSGRPELKAGLDAGPPTDNMVRSSPKIEPRWQLIVKNWPPLGDVPRGRVWPSMDEVPPGDTMLGSSMTILASRDWESP